VTSTCFDRIAELVTNRPELGDGSPLGLRTQAAVVVEDGEVVWVGDAGAAPATDERVDLTGRCVLPSFVDSHSHLVFGGDRVGEFTARMAGRAYSAGGIRTTIAATRAAPTRELRGRAGRLIAEMRRQGTGVVEIKSGYGAEVATERRCLEVAAELTEETTFLGAHVVGPEYVDDPAGYVALVTGEMLATCAPMARWIDVFVEDGAFDAEQARTILQAGAVHGLGARVHANQLGPGPGVQVACELGAASADHCTYLDDGDVTALADSGTVATLVPGAEFSTRSPVYPDGRRLVAAGATVALATDCNPGTSYTTSMPFVIALAVRECGLDPSQAVWSATAGGAAALRRDDVGHLGVGAAGWLTVLDAPSHQHLAYRPGVPLARVLAAPGPTSQAREP
jgi:imidazolonepropionase